jgi:hypothetical protein
MEAFSSETDWQPRLVDTGALDSDAETAAFIKIRARFYEECATESLSLVYANAVWNTFLDFCREIQKKGGFAGVVLDDTRLEIMEDSDESWQRPSGVRKTKGRKRKSNSKETKLNLLLAPLPIGPDFDTALSAFESGVARALDSIKSSAINDLNSFVEKRNEGRKLLYTVNYASIHASGKAWPRKWIDQSNGKHYFKRDGGHPNVLANLIALTRYEMGPSPQPSEKCQYHHYIGRYSTHWKYIYKYGKERLLPYLGLPCIYEALACAVVLSIEQPRFNVVALWSGDLRNDNGEMELAQAGLREETSGRLRMTLDKWRALAQKSSILTETASEALSKYLEITEPAREILRAHGRKDEADYLWIGVSLSTHEITRFTYSNLQRAFGIGDQRSNRLKVSVASGEFPPTQGRVLANFFQRHPELKQWSQVPPKALRLNAGILKFLRGDDNISDAMDAYGHALPTTTLKNYIPEDLLLKIYERQHRRHQNILIVSSHDQEEVRLQVTDFHTPKELNEFLASGIPNIKDSLGTRSEEELALGAFEGIAERQQAHSELFLLDDAYAIAVLLLYAEHLKGADNAVLEKTDPSSKLAPQFWVKFAECIAGDLPPSRYEVRQVVDLAKVLALTIRPFTTFSMDGE